MINLDFEVCDGKTFRDLCKDIIDRSVSKKDQLDTLFESTRAHIKNINDALTLLPRIKEILEVGVKNDEQIIKLTAILQKLQSTQLEATGGETGALTEEEKEQLQNSAKAQIESITKDIKTSDIPEIPLSGSTIPV